MDQNLQTLNSEQYNQELTTIETVTHLEQVPKIEVVEQVPKLEDVEQVSNLDGVEQVPKLEGVEQVPKLEGVEQVPKLDGVEHVPKLEGVEQVPKLEGVEQVTQVVDHVEQQNAPPTNIYNDRKESVSKSVRAGLEFPVGRIHRLLKRKYAGPVSETSSVYLAGVLEYLAREVLDVSAVSAKEDHRKRITNRSLYLGFQHDSDLQKLYKEMKILIPGGGVVPVCITKSKKATRKNVKNSDM
jgi:histone H2A